MPFPTPQYMITPAANSNLSNSQVDWLTSPHCHNKTGLAVSHKDPKFIPHCKTVPIAIDPSGTSQPGCHNISIVLKLLTWDIPHKHVRNAGPIRGWDRDHLKSRKVQHKLPNQTRQLSRWPYASASTFSHPLNALQRLQMMLWTASFLLEVHLKYLRIP